MSLTWTASTDNVGVTGYEVLRATGGGAGWIVSGARPVVSTTSTRGAGNDAVSVPCATAAPAAPRVTTTVWSLMVPTPPELMLPLMLLSQPMPNSTLQRYSGAVWASAVVAMAPPSEAHVADLLDFVGKWDRTAPMVIHCYAGISRSTAAAFITLCALNPATPETLIARRLREASPSATPTRRPWCRRQSHWRSAAFN